MLQVNKSAEDRQKTTMKTFSRSAEWILLSIGYSNDKRVKRAYFGIGDSQKGSVTVELQPTIAKIAVLFASSIEGFAEIDAKVAAFSVFKTYLSVGTIHRQSYNLPDTNLQGLVQFWRFNTEEYQNSALYSDNQIRNLSQFQQSNTQIDNSMGLTLINDNQLQICERSYNFDIGQCQDLNKKLGRGFIQITLVENIQLFSFTFGFWVYFPEETNAKLDVNFSPLATMEITPMAYNLKRGEISVHSKTFASTKLKKWVYIKQSGYKSVNWGVYMINNGAAEMNEHIKVETERRVGYIDTKVNSISLNASMNPVIRDIKIWGFSMPNHLVVGNIWRYVIDQIYETIISLSIIDKPLYEWSFQQKSGDTIYSDSVLNPSAHLTNLVQGTNYAWIQTQSDCLSDNGSFCESDATPTIVNLCTEVGKVYPWSTLSFSGCSTACQNGYSVAQNNICQETLCYQNFIQDQQFCKQQQYVQLIDASTIMQLSLGISISIFILFGAILNSPQGHIWALVSQLQLLYFLVFIKMEFPPNALIILKGLSFSTLGMVNRINKMIGQFIFTSKLVDDFSLGIQFTNNGVTSTIFSLLYEPKSYIFLALTVFSLLIALPCSRFCKNNNNEKCGKMFSICGGFNFWIRVLCFFYLQLCFFCFIGTFNLSTQTGPYVLSTMHDLAVLAVIVLLPILLMVILFKKKDWFFENRVKFQHLIFIEQMNFEVSPYLKLFYYPWYFIRRFAVAFVLVYLKDAPFWQCFCIGFLSLMTVSYYIRAKPFKKLRNILDIFDEMNVSIICSIIALLQQETRSLSDKQLASAGYIIVIFIFTNMGVRLIGIISELIEKCSKVDQEAQKIDISKYGGKTVSRLDAVNYSNKPSSSNKLNQSLSKSPLKHNSSMQIQEQQVKQSPYQLRKKYRESITAIQMGFQSDQSQVGQSPKRKNSILDSQQRRQTMRRGQSFVSPERGRESPTKSILSRASTSVSPEPQSKQPNRAGSSNKKLIPRKSSIPRPNVSSSSFYFPRKQ